MQTNTWVGGDPNPGTAFRVDRKGGYTVEPGYHFYKQLSRAGQPGMRVARVLSNDKDLKLMAFARAGTSNPDAFTVMNISETDKTFPVRFRGTTHQRFAAHRSSPTEQYKPLGSRAVEDGAIQYTAPARSATTFSGH